MEPFVLVIETTGLVVETNVLVTETNVLTVETNLSVSKTIVLVSETIVLMIETYVLVTETRRFAIERSDFFTLKAAQCVLIYLYLSKLKLQVNRLNHHCLFKLNGDVEADEEVKNLYW